MSVLMEAGTHSSFNQSHFLTGFQSLSISPTCVNFIFKDTFSLNSLHLIFSPRLKAPVGSGEWEGFGAYLSHSKITTAGFSHLPTGVSLMLLVEGLS